MDIEEWYHLQYLQSFSLNKNISIIDGLYSFLEILDLKKVKCTFFIVANLVTKYEKIIKEIIKNGHEIACHSLNHELPLSQKPNIFRDDLINAKKIIEDKFSIRIYGYRAPCFNLNDEYLKIVQDINFSYDSSLIRSNLNDKYGFINKNNFHKIENCIYKKNNFYEFEIPVLKKSFLNLPISGTGYMRLFNKRILKLIVNEYLKKNNSFLIYTHPYEFSSKKIKLPKNLNFSNKFKFHYGKKNLYQKLNFLINFLKGKNCQFMTFSEYLNASK